MKRLIFTLYHDGSGFCLSRNFKLQRVGDANWLLNNYKFGLSSYSIDELFILYVDRDPSQEKREYFLSQVSELISKVFIPIAIGGNIRSEEDARLYFDNGADKVVLNSALFSNPKLCSTLSSIYGRQAIVASLDCHYDSQSDDYIIVNPYSMEKYIALKLLDKNLQRDCGEFFFQSIDQDGNGSGFDQKLIEKIRELSLKNPIVVSGGAGKPEHFPELYTKHMWLSGISTGNLFNFLGDGLNISRASVINKQIGLPVFPEVKLF